MASDRRAYVRIPDSVLREPWDDATLADMVRIQCWLNSRWARDHLTAAEAGRAFLGPQEMMLVTRTSNATRARRRLLSLAERTAGVSLSVVEATRGRVKGVNFDWPKFHIEQAYRDRTTPEVGGKSGASKPLPLPRPASAPATAEEPRTPVRSAPAVSVVELTQAKPRKKPAGTATTRKFCESYAHHHDVEYSFQGRRDGAILAALVKEHGEGKVHEVIHRFHAIQDDSFLASRGYDVPGLKAKFQGLLLDKRVAGEKPTREVTQAEIEDASRRMKLRRR